MNANAMRGTILVAVLVLIGALILGLTDRSGSVPTATEMTVEETPTPDPEVMATQDVFPTPTPAPALTHSPAQVKVQVANASGLEGVAGNMTGKLSAAGYSTGSPTNAELSQVSVVFYEVGFDADALDILTNVFNSPDTRVEPMPDPPPQVDQFDPTTNVLMIVADDQLAKS